MKNIFSKYKMGNFLHGIGGFLVVVQLVTQISSSPVVSFLAVQPTDKVSLSCYDYDSDPVLELLPNPYNCQKYYSCTEEEPGRPIPTQMDCQDGHDGNPLWYDFRTCQCEYQEIVECFDLYNPGHVKELYTCTEKLHHK